MSISAISLEKTGIILRESFRQTSQRKACSSIFTVPFSGLTCKDNLSDSKMSLKHANKTN